MAKTRTAGETDSSLEVSYPPDTRIVLENTGDVLDREAVRLLCDGVVDPKKQKFLMYLAVLGTRSRAARAVPISTVSTWMWRRDDDVFRARYEDAMKIAAELHETEMFRRASEGVLEPVFQGGRLVGSVRKFSDGLLMFALKGAMPEKYRENIKVTGEIDLVGRLRAARERALGRGGE